MQDVVIVAATRTAIGSFQGSLATVSAVDLGAAVIRRLLEQTGLDGAQVDEVIMGQVLTDLAYLEIENGAFVLKERAPGVSVEEIVAKTAGKLIVPDHVPEMHFQ